MNKIKINLEVIKEILHDKLLNYKQSEVETLHFVSMWEEAYYDEYYVYVDMYIIVALKIANHDNNGFIGDSEFSILEKDYLKKIAEYRDERIEEIFK